MDELNCLKSEILVHKKMPAVLAIMLVNVLFKDLQVYKNSDVKKLLVWGSPLVQILINNGLRNYEFEH